VRLKEIGKLGGEEALKEDWGGFVLRKFEEEANLVGR
jgi:hypothetical protein